MGLSPSAWFWHTGVSALFSQEAAPHPHSFMGGSFGEVGTPTIVSQNKREAGLGEGAQPTHRLEIRSLSCRSAFFGKV